MTNTEKPTTMTEQKKQGIVETPKKQLLPKTPFDTSKKQIPKKDIQLNDKLSEPLSEEDKQEEKSPETKTTVVKKETPKIKKTESIVKGVGVPISTKDSIAICRFIKKKKIETAIKDLEQVLLYKKAIPMKGEIPHRKGKNMMSGRYPKKSTEHFIRLLKSLQSNAIANEIDEPIITEAIANLASRPQGRFGNIRRKRTHIKITVKEKKIPKRIGERK